MWNLIMDQTIHANYSGKECTKSNKILSFKTRKDAKDYVENKFANFNPILFNNINTKEMICIEWKIVKKTD